MGIAAAGLACAHCGEPVAATRPEGSRYCCAGCEYVHGLRAGVPPRAPPAPARTIETVLQVEGVSCSACVARVGSALGAIDGVSAAGLDFATRRARVVHRHDVALETLLQALGKAGYRAHEARDAEAWERAERRRSLWHLALAGFAMMQIMMFALPAYVADEGTLPWDVARLFSLASLALTLPVLAISARPIFAAAWHGVIARSPGMDLPVALGIIAAFGASLPNTFYGGDVYYDSIAMFVFLLLAARHLERRALARTAETTESLAELLPRRARRITAEGFDDVECRELAVGDRVSIGIGEAAPADLALVGPATHFDEAVVTGESAPVAKHCGDTLLAGTVNLTSPVEATVIRAGADQTLERIRTLVERAALDRPQWTLLADRVARQFATGVVVLAAAGAIAWWFIDPSRALWVAVATLVVSCPCALALATPAAFTAAINGLARSGVLVTRARALESLASITHFVFDKTGTLTTGRLRLAHVATLGRLEGDECVALAASLESALPHPVAHALATASPRRVPRARFLNAVVGEGVEGVIDGRRYRVGSARFCAALAESPVPSEPESSSPGAWLAAEGAWLASFHFEDSPRPEAARLVERLRDAGCEVVLLSGDRRAVVEPLAAALGIRERVAGADPRAKAAFVARLIRTGARVAMVGDGVNDAPVLAGAHVAIAPASGTAIAQSQADFVLANPSLEALADALAAARRTRRIVKQNLAWAALYNAVSIPLALAGVLTPWIAALGMAASSLLVVTNALRLLRPAS